MVQKKAPPPPTAAHCRTEAQDARGCDDESAPLSRRQKELAATNRLLDEAPGILQQVQESYLFEKARQQERLYPTFGQQELKLGKVLGVGGFGIVFEVKAFDLQLPPPPQEIQIRSSITAPATTNQSLEPREFSSFGGKNPSISSKSEAATAATENCSEPSTAAMAGLAMAGLAIQQSSISSSSPQILQPNAAAAAAAASDTPTSVAFSSDWTTLNKEEDINNTALQAAGLVSHDDDHGETHYDVASARRYMMQHVVRSTTTTSNTNINKANVKRPFQARYAVKKLHGDLSDLERTRGMIDLAMEAKFLSVLWHPNIVKMRGYASGPLLHANFFIVLDRLYETLAEKMETWSARHTKLRGPLFGLVGANKQELQKLLVERLTVAYDMASAFWYMHQRKLVYRDVKQENVGFDLRGDVKIFDFGLSKALSPSLKARDAHGREIYGYQLTCRTGSIPYMAPEVAMCQPYNEKCDVFSFSILLWEILALKPAFEGYSRREFLERVAKGKERHAIRRPWPPMTRLALKEGWDHNPKKRPDMKRFAVLLRGDLKDMSMDPTIQNRTTHMLQRSNNSNHGITSPSRLHGSARGNSRAAATTSKP